MGRRGSRKQSPSHATPAPPLAFPPVEYLADPSAITAALIMAEEVRFRRDCVQMLGRVLSRLVVEMESGLSEPSTSAALARAVGDTMDRMLKYGKAIEEIGTASPADQVGVTLAKLGALTKELARLRKSAALREDATTTSSVSIPSETAPPANLLSPNDPELT